MNVHKQASQVFRRRHRKYLTLLLCAIILSLSLPVATKAAPAPCEDNSLQNRLKTEMGIDVNNANPPIDLSKLSNQENQEVTYDLQILYQGRVLRGDPDCNLRTAPELGLYSLSQIIEEEITIKPASIAQDMLLNTFMGMTKSKLSTVLDYFKVAANVFALFQLQKAKEEQELIIMPYVNWREQGKTDQAAWDAVKYTYSGYGNGPNQIHPDSDIYWAVENLNYPQKADALHAEALFKYEASDDQTYRDTLKQQIRQDLKEAQVATPTQERDTGFFATIRNIANFIKSAAQKTVEIFTKIVKTPPPSPGGQRPNTSASIGQAVANILQPTQETPKTETNTSSPAGQQSQTSQIGNQSQTETQQPPTVPQQTQPTQQQTPQQQTNSILCNGQYWANKCSASQTFYCSPTGGGECQATNKPNINTSELEQQIHALINNERQKQSLVALNWDGRLADIARGHSQDMATRNYAAHESPDGCDPACRYKQNNYGFSMLAENISGWTTYKTRYPDGVVDVYNTQSELASWIVQGWMNSPGHRANILAPNLSNEGIGVVIKDDGGVLTTEDFAVPTGQQTATEPSSATIDISPLSLEAGIMTEIITYRPNFSPGLRQDDALVAIAEQHSQDMANNGYVSSTDLSGCDVSCRYKKAGYSFSSAGENVSRWLIDKSYYSKLTDYSITRPDIAKEIVDSWTRNYNDSNNMSNGNFTREGISVVIGNDGYLYTTLDFAVPATQTQIAQQPSISAPTSVSPSSQSSQGCGQTFISFPKNGATYSLDDPNFPLSYLRFMNDFEQGFMSDVAAHGVVFSTKATADHYSALFLSPVGWITGSAKGTWFAMGAGGTSPVGEGCDGYIAGPAIDGAGKAYVILYRKDILQNLSFQDITKMWEDYIDGKGAAPVDDFYISAFNVIGGRHTVTATITDQSGNPVPDDNCSYRDANNGLCTDRSGTPFQGRQAAWVGVALKDKDGRFSSEGPTDADGKVSYSAVLNGKATLYIYKELFGSGPGGSGPGHIPETVAKTVDFEVKGSDVDIGTVQINL